MINDRNKDLRSNLNTSCASSILSASNTTFSEISPNRAIRKINDLKGLYYETIQEQASLAHEKKTLLVQLSNLKEELTHLIQDKFSGHRKPKTTQSTLHSEKDDKLYRVGCISKINKAKVNNKQEISEKKEQAKSKYMMNTIEKRRRWQNKERKTMEKQKTYKLDSENKKNNSGHRKSQTNIYEQLKKDVEIPRKTSLRKWQAAGEREELYSIMGKQNSQSEKWSEKTGENLGIQFQRRSYLNSPRSSLLSSPRFINKALH